MTTNTVILLAAVAVALVAGFVIRARSGKVRASREPDSPVPDSRAPDSRVSDSRVSGSSTSENGATENSTPDADPSPNRALTMLLDAGVSQSNPTVLHFSATWCGPCAAVRRVVEQTRTKLAAEGLTVLDLELDIDENPALAKQLKVLSLPTTFIYDSSATQHHRIAGVPKADALLAALRQLS